MNTYPKLYLQTIRFCLKFMFLSSRAQLRDLTTRLKSISEMFRLRSAQHDRMITVCLYDTSPPSRSFDGGVKRPFNGGVKHPFNGGVKHPFNGGVKRPFNGVLIRILTFLHKQPLHLHK